MPPSQPLLACYDYGQGAVWLLMDAKSPAEVEQAYPFLTAFSSAPSWMDSRQERQLRDELEAKGFRWNVSAEPSGWLLSAAQEQPSPMLPKDVANEVAPVATSLQRAGFKLVRVLAGSTFGNYFVTFARGPLAVTVARDRGQFIVSGPPRQQLEEAGLWRTFSSAKGVESAIRSWLSSGDA